MIPDDPSPTDPSQVPPPIPAPDPVPPPPPPPASVPLPPSGPAGVPVVFQHGFKSKAEAWTDMRDRLRPQLQIVDDAFSIPVFGDLYNAADSLNAAVRSRFGGQRVLAVAHSAGGLVSRRAIFRDPGMISGLITVGTPHRGALIAERGQDAVAALTALLPAIWTVTPCESGLLNPNGIMCSQYFVVGAGAAASLAGIVLSAGPIGAARDLEPGSNFVSDVNAPAESFIRVGITHRVPRRWSLAMWGSEYRGQPLPWNPDVAARASYEISDAYRRALITFVQATVMIWLLSEMEIDQGRLQINYSCGPAWTSPSASCGYDPSITPSLRSAYSSGWYNYLLTQQAVAAGTVLTFNIADWIWNKSVADNRTSDAFIAAESQQFPNNPGSAIPPVNIESDRTFGRGPLVGHSGETHSDMVRFPLDFTLRTRFGAEPRLF